ncbi:MAG: MBL fold metallo-hydrolase, partial [Myxococcota bacterium]
MPRLFEKPESIPGLTHPTLTFSDSLTIELGAQRGVLELRWMGRGHTEGDIVAWLPKPGVVFTGDLVESEAALYTGDAFHLDWMAGTLDAVRALDAKALVGGRGEVVRDTEVSNAIEQTRSFLLTLRDAVAPVKEQGGTLKHAFDRAHAALAPAYGAWPIFEHCLPFDVSRLWDELEGKAPVIWTAERDRAVWDLLQN